MGRSQRTCWGEEGHEGMRELLRDFAGDSIAICWELGEGAELRLALMRMESFRRIFLGNSEGSL